MVTIDRSDPKRDQIAIITSEQNKPVFVSAAKLFKILITQCGQETLLVTPTIQNCDCNQNIFLDRTESIKVTLVR